ncbi:PREDICTED: protein msta, isoform B-like isoform X2 [Vollenhovia emeryi]|uniref:protein msta, isoform B-like isoform X2 n=1 Tax=Vollenhovia emeryi TaxID=411798 RepID=UPI0005F3B270|nr:PREDICTED: protein msta, isoform B-like isoform X2 [Vollenhovia emeryi]XP_011880734.1 PREDICTED: protein msta, isoform B-like isoform X2 [Vollenhovia emeryi]
MEPHEAEELLKSHLRENNLWTQDEPRSWTVGRSPLGGRGLFAMRDVRAGELIFTDVPLLIGPRCYNKYLPMCVVCYKSDCPLFPCDHGCGLPICSTECEDSVVHIQGECWFLKGWTPTCGSTWSKDLLLAVVPIRGLTLSEEQRKLLHAFECHANLTRNYEIDLLKKNVVSLPNEEQLELMRRICGVFNTNSFEVVVVSSRDQDRTTSLRGLYPMGAFQNHCCVPNTRHHFDDQQRMHVSAALPIAAGEEITMSYTDLLWDTSSRRQFLKVTKRFSCNCNRCSDPLEFGSQLGALLCAMDDCSGHLLPRNPLNYESSWICYKCQTSVNHRQIEYIHSGLNTFVSDAVYKTPREILRFTETVLSKLVPATNYILLDVKYRIISYFGRASDLKWENLTDAELRIKQVYCDDILSALDALDSGDSIKKGLVLYELYRTNLELFKRQISNNDEQTHPHIKDDDNERLLQKAMSILQNDVGAACVRKSD